MRRGGGGDAGDGIRCVGEGIGFERWVWVCGRGWSLVGVWGGRQDAWSSPWRWWSDGWSAWCFNIWLALTDKAKHSDSFSCPVDPVAYTAASLVCQYGFCYLSTMPLLIAFARHTRASPTRRSLGIDSIMLYMMADIIIVMLPLWYLLWKDKRKLALIDGRTASQDQAL